jgi:hypothetical protein
MLVTFVASVPHGHSSILAFLVDGNLVIGVCFAFGAVGSHLFRGLHTDHGNFASMLVEPYLWLMEQDEIKVTMRWRLHVSDN